MTPRPPRPTLFPYTTLFRSIGNRAVHRMLSNQSRALPVQPSTPAPAIQRKTEEEEPLQGKFKTDRKSTRLNSSHLGISYAVFCLKKKKQKKEKDITVKDKTN